MKAVRGQKHTLDAKNGMKKLIYWKKYLTKVSQQPQQPLSGSNQIWATTSDKKDTATSEVTVESCSCWIKQTEAREAGFRVPNKSMDMIAFLKCSKQITKTSFFLKLLKSSQNNNYIKTGS